MKTLTKIPRIHVGRRFRLGKAERAERINGGLIRPKPHPSAHLPLRALQLLTKAHYSLDACLDFGQSFSPPGQLNRRRKPSLNSCMFCSTSSPALEWTSQMQLKGVTDSYCGFLSQNVVYADFTAAPRTARIPIALG